MTKGKLHEVVCELLNEIYELEGTNCSDRTLGEIMGIMSLARELESEVSIKAPDHGGCGNCKWVLRDEREQPCVNCKHNYLDQWEEINE